MSAAIIGEIIVTGMLNLALQKIKLDALVIATRAEDREPTQEELATVEAERRDVMEKLNSDIDAAINRARA